jgi:hypothetical protein
MLSIRFIAAHKQCEKSTERAMRGKIKTLATIAGIAISVLAFMPETASARMGGGGFRGGGFGGGFRGGAVAFRGAGFGAAGIRTGAIGAGLGYRGAALGWRGGAIGWRGGALGWRGAAWRGGWGYRRWPYYAAGAALGYGLASSYYYPDYYYGGYGYGDGYDGCVVERRLVLTDWGYRPALVRVCY